MCVDPWCRDVGGYPPHGTGPGGSPGPGGAAADGAAPVAEAIQEVDVHLGDSGESGGVFLADGDIH